MTRILVNIISLQTIPNYLFIKDFYQKGDKLLFFTSSTMTNPLDYIIKTIKLTIELNDDDIEIRTLHEENWQTMCQEISSAIKSDIQYLVNTTGGTKYMSMAVSEEFHKHHNVRFFYTPYPKNIYLHLDKPSTNIQSKLSIDEYLSLYNVQKKNEGTTELVKNEEYTKHFFKLFTDGKIINLEGSTLDSLRKYRKEGVGNIAKTETEDSKKRPQIIGLGSFLRSIDFICCTENKLSKDEVKYLTGGWFEEYVFSIVKNLLQPDDITMGLLIGDAQNDLDVVFTLGNKLYVCECKTGIMNFKPENVSAMFSEIVYKLTALKDSLGNLSAFSYVCALTPPHDQATKVAKYFNQTYCDRDIFIDPNKTINWINDLKKRANTND